jgi:hypothetical protein
MGQIRYASECACSLKPLDPIEKTMARKKKVKRFRAVPAVKELARERVGAPPAGQIVVEKKKKPEKHKPTLGKLLDQSE